MNEQRTISVEGPALPPFEFTCGYTLRCFDLADDGIKIELNHKYENAAILLPPETADQLAEWVRTRKLRSTGLLREGLDCKVQSRHKVKPSDNKAGAIISPAAAKELNTIERALAGLEGLYEIIEEDTGVTPAQIRNGRSKTRLIVETRAIVCFILQMRYGLKTLASARIINAKTHATVLLTLRKFDRSRFSYEFYERAEMREVYRDAKKRYRRTKCKVTKVN